MYELIDSIKDAIIAFSVGMCGKNIYRRIKKWYYNEKDIKIDDINIEFIPQRTDEETILVNEKNRKPKVFKFYSNVE